MLEEYPDVLNTCEVMEILDITKNLMYKLIHENEIRAFRVGGRRWRVNKDDLIDYLKKH